MELLVAAAVCLGIGILNRLSNDSTKKTCQLLREAIRVTELKGLGECLENKEIENHIVVVRGTVGSTSTVDKSSLGVFIEETVSIDIKKKNDSVTKKKKTVTRKKKKKTNDIGLVVPESKTFKSSKKVPWYLDDGTAQVYVCNYLPAKGFYDTLVYYFSREPVITCFKSFVFDEKEKLLLTHDVDCNKHQRVLEIGTYLTVVGKAERDKDGAPTIAEAYRFFNGHIELDDFVNNLELESETAGFISSYLIALSAFLVALNILQTDADDI